MVMMLIKSFHDINTLFQTDDKKPGTFLADDTLYGADHQQLCSHAGHHDVQRLGCRGNRLWRRRWLLYLYLRI